MKLKMLPWFLVVGLSVGLAALYWSGEKQAAELAQLRQDSQELQGLRAAAEETKGTLTQSENEELIRLRKDNAELLRLRNEVRQLRDQGQQLTRQVETAQAQAQNAQLQVQQAQAQAQQARTAARPPAPFPPGMTPEQAAALRARYGAAPAVMPEQEQINACINNLRQIDAAKQQWALENRKPGGALPNVSDVTPYLKGNTLPTCPAGGSYTLNAVTLPPTCTIPGHVLTK